MLREEFLLPMGITQQQLADGIQVPFQRINELVNGKRVPEENLTMAGRPDSVLPRKKLSWLSFSGNQISLCFLIRPKRRFKPPPFRRVAFC
jgi:plasmid maintenance system antidote protein VapI